MEIEIRARARAVCLRKTAKFNFDGRDQHLQPDPLNFCLALASQFVTFVNRTMTGAFSSCILSCMCVKCPVAAILTLLDLLPSTTKPNAWEYINKNEIKLNFNVNIHSA